MSECRRTPLHSPLYIPHLTSAPSKPSPRSATPFSLTSSLPVPNRTHHRHAKIQLPSHHTFTKKQAKLLAHLPTSQMGRHGNEASPSIIRTSSIALLQERFRNLQKVKEMREGRELQRVHAPDHTDRAGSMSALNLGLQAAHNNEQPRWFLHPDLIQPSRPLHAQTYGLDAKASRTSTPPANSWGGMQNSSFRSDVDVDTSLHL